MAQDGAKLEPRWPSWALDGHLEATWGVILAILRALRGDLHKNGQNEQRYNVLATCLGLGGLVGGSWVVFKAILPQLGFSWAISTSSWELFGNILGLR